jgi:hypothetical protein
VHEGRMQTARRDELVVDRKARLINRPWSRTEENSLSGILGGTMETAASFEARFAPSSYPTQQATGVGIAATICGEPKRPTNHPCENERAGCKSPPPHLSEGRGEVFFPDILFYRMSVIEIFRQPSPPHCSLDRSRIRHMQAFRSGREAQEFELNRAVITGNGVAAKSVEVAAADRSRSCRAYCSRRRPGL